jgi:Trk-type K+ transport system membrane component
MEKTTDLVIFSEKETATMLCMACVGAAALGTGIGIGAVKLFQAIKNKIDDNKKTTKK